MRLILLLLTSLLFVNCAPELEDIQPEPIPQLIINREFSQKLAYNAELPFPLQSLDQLDIELSTTDLLKFLKLRLYISHSTNNAVEKEKTLAMIEQVLSLGYFFEEEKLANGKYVDALLGFAYDDVKTEIGGVKETLNSASQIVPSKLNRLSGNYRWPSLSRFKLSQTKAYVFDYFDLVPKQLRAFNVYEPIVVEVEKELKSGDTRAEIENLSRLLTQLENSKSLANSLNILDRVIGEYEIDLSSETLQDLEEARYIAYSISQVHDASTAFELIVWSWLITSPEDREQVFSSQSRDLYEFLRNRNEGELYCYIPSKSCAGPVRYFVRELAIIPEIEGYGVLKIRDQVDRAASEVLIDVVKGETLDFLKDIDSLLSEKILAGIRKSYNQVDQVTRDPVSFVKNLIVGSELNEKSFFRFKEQFPGKMKIKDSFLSESESSELMPSNLEVKALLFELIHLFLVTDDKLSVDKADKLLLSFIEFTLDLSGVKTYDGSYIESSYSFVKSSKRIEYALDLPLIKEPTYLESSESSSVFWRSHGRLIRVLTSFMPFFQDWNRSLFDEGLGGVYVQDILKDFSSETLNQKLFPKDAIYAMVFANCVLLVKNLSYKGMGLYVANQNFDFVAFNDEDPRPEKQSAMGAIIDQNEFGDQFAETKTNTILVSALANLLNEAALIENSNSQLIRDSLGGEELSGLKQILADLELLTIGMSNFVSHYLQSPEGKVYSKLRKYDQRTFEFFEEEVDAGFYAIDSYVDIHNKTQVTTYKWSAQQAFEFLLTKSRNNEKVKTLDAYNLNGSYLKIKSIQQIKKSGKLN